MVGEARLDTWKEIADYLNKDVRTVIRWEKDRGLPVHRMPGKKRSSVYAWTSEIDSWLASTAASPSDGNGVTELVRTGIEPDISVPATSIAIPTRPAKSRPRGLWLIGFATIVSLGVAAGFLGFWARPRLPRLGSPVQITSNGLEKGRVVVGSTSLFFTSKGGGRTTLTRIDLNGGKESILPFGANGFDLQDISPNGSELLVAEFASKECIWPLWVVPTNGGPPRRIADLCARTGAWSPDGRKLAYVTARELFLANSDGTQPHRLVTLSFPADDLRWSPDGTRLRFVLFDRQLFPGRIWEVSVDGSSGRRLLPGWSRAAQDLEDGGCWTLDGRFFIFMGRHSGADDLWVIREQRGPLDWRDRGPFRLTTSPNGTGQPVLSRDGKKLFAIATAPERGELMRYDPIARRFATYPDQAGISAAHASFSLDGRQVAYITHPEMGLWKMNADGTGRQMLTDHAALPQWSPDGRRIAFMGFNDDNHKPTRIQVISVDGGRREQPVPSPEWQGAPTWTSDGSGLIFGENGPFFPIAASCSIHLFDFESGKTSDLPGSTGLWTAWACPTGRYIAAVTRDDRKLVLYDLRTAAWTELASFADSVIGDNPTWSRDGKFIYVDAPFSANPAIYRIGIPGRRMERVADLKGIQRVHGNMGAWIGLTPDNLPLILRAVQSNEIYAWDWITP